MTKATIFVTRSFWGEGSFYLLTLLLLKAVMPRALFCLVFVGLSLTSFYSQAIERTFPRNTERADITFTSNSEVQVWGVAEKLSPSVRIHEPRQNRLIFAHTLKGQTLTVNYWRDNTNKIREIWILTPQEIAQKLPLTQKRYQAQRQWLLEQQGGNNAN